VCVNCPDIIMQEIIIGVTVYMQMAKWCYKDCHKCGHAPIRTSGHYADNKLARLSGIFSCTEPWLARNLQELIDSTTGMVYRHLIEVQPGTHQVMAVSMGWLFLPLCDPSRL
jgi:hypothetical protein